MSEIDDYVKTSNGNFVSRKAEIYGSQNLFIKGKSIIMPRVLVRGELQSIRIGRFCVIGESTVLRPAYRIEPDGSQLKCRFTPLSVGNYTSIGKNCIIEAAGIGCNVRIDDGCILGRNSFVRDNSHLLEGTILPEDAVVPPFTVMGGCPAKAVSVLHESTVTMCPEDAVAFYDAFETRS